MREELEALADGDIPCQGGVPGRAAVLFGIPDRKGCQLLNYLSEKVCRFSLKIERVALATNLTRLVLYKVDDWSVYRRRLLLGSVRSRITLIRDHLIEHACRCPLELTLCQDLLKSDFNARKSKLIYRFSFG